MEVILLAIYAFFVWLIFFKFKWLPWTTTAAVIVVTIPIVSLAAILLLLNVYAPSALDVRVIKYVVPDRAACHGASHRCPGGTQSARPERRGPLSCRSQALRVRGSAPRSAARHDPRRGCRLRGRT